MMRLHSARRGLVMLTTRQRPCYQGALSFIDSSGKRYLSTNNGGGDRRNNNTDRSDQNNNNSRGRRRNNSGKSLLKGFEGQLNKFRQRVFRLPALEPTASLAEVDAGYQSLVRDARILVDQLEEAVEQGRLDYRFTREVTFILQQALYLFRTSYPDCQRVLQLCKRWNLDISDQKPAMVAACLAGEWKEASRMFQRLIDPDVAGYTPMEISVREPLGLYAIARTCEDSTAVAEQVMNAAMSMSMVNPTDQDKYVLAAGTALGQVGAWKEFIEYKESSLDRSRLGQPLIAAVMHACLLNDQPEEALKQFAELTDGPASVGSEWQWGGGSDVVDPVVRDIAMRAGGPLSLDLYWQAMDEGFQVSNQALRAVIDSCTDVAGALSIMDKLCDDLTWLVDGADLVIERCDQPKKSITYPVDKLQPIVLELVRRCNGAREFGMSLLGYQLLMPRSSTDDFETAMIDRISVSSNQDEHLAAVMTALCGVNSTTSAHNLFEALSAGKVDAFPLSSGVNEYSSSMASLAGLTSALNLSERIVSVVNQLPDKVLTTIQTQKLLTAVAQAMRAFNVVSQPQPAIFLFRQIEKKLKARQEVPASVGGAVRSFLGIEEEEEEKADVSLLAMSDPVLAEMVWAHRTRRAPEQALWLFETVLESSEKGYEAFPLTVTQALEALVAEGRTEAALDIFHSLDAAVWTPDMFVALSNALLAEKKWKSVQDLYHLSMKSGCLTEALGLAAMQAVVNTPDLDGKMTILRTIIKDICSITGTTNNEWHKARYWALKKKLGIRYSRLIMRWNDERTSDLFELQFAVEEFTERKTAGLRPRNDVLWSLVRGCKHIDRAFELIHQLDIRLPLDKKVWANLLGHVIVELQKSGLRNDQKFVADLVRALRAVGANAASEEFLSDSLSRGVMVDQTLLLNQS